MEEKRQEAKVLQHLKVTHEELASKIRYYGESIGRLSNEIKDIEEKIGLQEERTKSLTAPEHLQDSINNLRQKVQDEKDAWARTTLYLKEID